MGLCSRGRKYSSIRFGNVIGSRVRKSATMEYSIRAHWPVSVTGAEATKFMSASGASRLVMQVAALCRPGGIFVLDMGKPASILKVAEKMISLSGKNIPIGFTGLRKIEKLHKALAGERGQRQLITRSFPSKTRPRRILKALPRERALLLQRHGSGSAELGVKESVSQIFQSKGDSGPAFCQESRGA